MAALVPEPLLLILLGALLARCVATGKGRELEGKVEFCQATAGKGEAGTTFSPTPPDPAVAAAAKPPRVGLAFPARISALFAERNFPGRSGGQGNPHSTGVGSRRDRGGLRRGDGGIAGTGGGDFAAGKWKRQV